MQHFKINPFYYFPLLLVISLLLVRADCDARGDTRGATDKTDKTDKEEPKKEAEETPLPAEDSPSPQVTVDSPAHGARFQSGEPILLRYEARNMLAEELALKDIVIWLDGKELSVDNGETLPSDLEPGEHTIEIKLTDGTLLRKITFYVEEESQPPDNGRQELALRVLDNRYCNRSGHNRDIEVIGEEEAIYGNERAGGDPMTIIRSRDTWQTMWQRFGCRSEDIVEIDFESKMVILRLAGWFSYIGASDFCNHFFGGKFYSENGKLYLSIDYRFDFDDCGFGDGTGALDFIIGAYHVVYYEVDKRNDPIYRGEPLCYCSSDLGRCDLWRNQIKSISSGSSIPAQTRMPYSCRNCLKLFIGSASRSSAYAIPKASQLCGRQ